MNKQKMAAYQFELQAQRLELRILQRLPDYRYTLTFGTELRLNALILCSSFDFYEERFYHRKKPLDLIIAQSANAVLPRLSVSLTTGEWFNAGGIPTLPERTDRRNHNRAESQMLISRLILGMDCTEEMSKLSARSQRRYLASRDEYLSKR